MDATRQHLSLRWGGGGGVYHNNSDFSYEKLINTQQKRQNI